MPGLPVHRPVASQQALAKWAALGSQPMRQMSGKLLDTNDLEAQSEQDQVGPGGAEAAGSRSVSGLIH